MKSDWALRTQDRDGNDHGSTNSGRAIELIKGPEKKKKKKGTEKENIAVS